jgi:N-acetylglutamate synthase-like GNAT family acetyltransferase
MALIRWLQLLYGTWYPWNHKAVLSRLRPLTFRLAREEDFPWCVALLERNEAHGVPANHGESYLENLRSGKQITMIAEDASGPVGTFGLNWLNTEVAWLSYVLVDPRAHRSGVGTTMLLGSLSLLRRKGLQQYMMLGALETSLSFYQKLGFVFTGIDQTEGNPYLQAALGPISPMLVADCGKLLKKVGAVIPDLGVEIPLEAAGAIAS